MPSPEGNPLRQRHRQAPVGKGQEGAPWDDESICASWSRDAMRVDSNPSSQGPSDPIYSRDGMLRESNE